MKRLLCVILAAVLMLGMPLPVLAETMSGPQVAGTFSVPTQVNPVGADPVDQSARLPQPESRNATPNSFDETLYITEGEAASIIRGHLKDRTVDFTMYIRTTNPDLQGVIIGVMDQAFAHTGVPDEGDYLKWQYHTWDAHNITYYHIGDTYYLNIPYTVEYRTTADQEAQVDAAVAGLLEELDLYDSTPYEKVRGIYDYITANVTYDYENVDDNDHLLKYTAYAALIDGTAVCQGYSNLFYRLAQELGVDNRIIVGEADGGVHSWNLVGLDGKYYYVDATWDAARVEAGMAYAYFLKGSEQFTDHAAYTKTVASFLPGYAVSATDYGDPDAGTGDIGQDPSEEHGWNCDANEWAVLRETNRQRYIHGLNPLTTNALLCQAGDIRADEISGYYSHARPDGTECFTVLDELDIFYTMAAENIAAGQSTPEAVVDAWMNSDGHRANILTAGLAHMDAGFTFRENDAYGNYWVQLFYTGWSCAYTDLRVTLDVIEVAYGTQLDQMDLWATITCSSCGTCYLPILAEYCTGYNPTQPGTQTVTVSCLGLNDTLTIVVDEQEIIYGDVNGDGKVNSRDVILLRQYIAGWNVEIDLAAANVNGDANDKVNSLDMILLRQYVAGWNVTLGK